MSETELLRLVALNGYAAYRNALNGCGRLDMDEYWRRSANPVPGDVVFEWTSQHLWVRNPGASPGAALGVLLRVCYEPSWTQSEMEKYHACGDYWIRPEETIEDIPKEKVFYVRPLDGSSEECRWVNAGFIALASSAWKP